MSAFREEPAAVLARLRALREADAPTHGGRVLSYVYDPDDVRIDELAAEAMRIAQPVNWLDPMTFPSAAAVERDVLGFVRGLLHGDEDVVGTITTGGTESCLLAVKSARDVWLRAHGAVSGAARPRLVAPTTVHAAFQKGADYLGLELDPVPVEPDGRVSAASIAARLERSDDVALVVVSAPSYPFASLDPVVDVAAITAAAGVPLHVDACVGGLVLPFWPGLSDWDFRVPGVTSMSADLHKYGYAPKGVSVLLQRGRDLQRQQFFATTRWPGYPVVNPTILGSRSTMAAAAAWAIIQALGEEGYRARADVARSATEAIRAAVAGIEGLRIVGDPVGPMLAVAADAAVPEARRVDPHRWTDAVRGRGFAIQQQPSRPQPDGTRLPGTTHFTVTPVTARVLDELLPVLSSSADEVRGLPPASAAELLGALPPLTGAIDSASAGALLAALGLGGGSLPGDQATLLAAIEALPPELAERLLIEMVGRIAEPTAS